MNEPRTDRWKERLLVITALVLIVVLLGFFLGDILIPFLRLELRNDVEGARELLRERGALGFLTVTLVEALQMVVIFVPAEFIQISSGLSYPFPIALLLCDLGACLGATIIFLLVRTFRFRSSAFEKRKAQLDKISGSVHTRSSVLILYLLFFMPIIPFGAICYYGSSTRIRYPRYLFTVATAVIPSIVVSNLMGAAGRAFLVNDLPFWLLILVIVVLAAALFALIYFFLDRFCFRESDQTPDSPVYAMLFLAAKLIRGRRGTAVIEDHKLSEAEAPYLLLCNHQSFYDFYYVSQMAHPKNPSYLVNEYYTTRPFLKTLAKKAGILSKKLFTPDLASAAGILRTVRAGYPIVIFPEGRLSPDGRTNPIVEPGARLYRKLNVDLVLATVHGAYFGEPKWRRRIFRSDIRVRVERVLKKEEVQAMPEAELDDLIARTLWVDASAEPGDYPRRNRAKGLENLLYRCADCGALYTTVGEGSTLRCTACGRVHTLDRHYRFADAPDTIPGWYDRIKELERAELDRLDLRAAVRTRIFGKGGGPVRKETGECRLTPAGFSYQSASVSFEIPIDRLPALAFSCGLEFELYHQSELYYFYPREHPQQAARWALAVDLLAEKRRQT